MPPPDPPVQLRELLTGMKRSGAPFARAWMAARDRVKMPHSTEERREWAEILNEQRHVWESAYNDWPTGREDTLRHLVAEREVRFRPGGDPFEGAREVAADARRRRAVMLRATVADYAMPHVEAWREALRERNRHAPNTTPRRHAHARAEELRPAAARNLAAMYRAGFTLPELADMTEVSRETVRALIVAEGVEIRPRGVPKGQRVGGRFAGQTAA